MRAVVDAVSRPAGAVSGAPALPVADIFAEITAGLADGHQLETLLGQFLVPIVRLAGAQAGVVRALCDDGEHLRLVGDIGLPADVRLSELSVDRHCGTCGMAADSDTMTWSVDLRSCARHNNDDAAYFGGHFKRMLAVPLRHRGRLLGIYNLFFESDAALGADLLSVLRSIGELLGLALHNARLEREHLFATVMNERKFLASEVHDSIAQNLVYVNMRLPLLHDAMLRHDDPLSLKYLADVKQAVSGIHTNLREILTNFRASMDPQGLLHALKGLAEEFGQRSGMVLHCACDATDLGLSVEQEVQVFHIVQEALANVYRHAQARQAWLTLRRSARQLELLVEDDGAGLATEPAGPAQPAEVHFGLGIMRERAQRLGGVLEIGARAAGGTQVRLCVPLPAARAPQEAA
jgi:two-component system nitrate/nitrite sensor histidine kinase NarX